MKPLILIIDDEPDIRDLIGITLGRMNLDYKTVPDLGAAKKILKTTKFDLCLTDMKLPDGDGVDFVKYIQHDYPEVPVAVITAHGNMETAIQAMKNGAFDFLNKPVDLEQLRTLVDNALKLNTARWHKKNNLVGTSDIINKTRETISKVARSQAPIYICGESGTGKELVARMIHEQSSRSEGNFVPVNCGAIPPDLMESEFFGHKKGSFTGAIADKEGFFQAANGGTLFLDEVAELPEHMQVKLLRSIQEKTIRQIGTHKEIPVNTRILSATNKNLSDMVSQGKFRQDFYYRINVIELHVPPLREHRDDIPQLIEHFLEKIASQNELSKVPRISDEAQSKLMQYDFPGNVRELENILERAYALCDGNEISAELMRLQSGNENQNLAINDNNLNNFMEEIEKKKIIEALENTRWNKTKAAKKLGISFRALRYRLEKLGLNDKK